jgi:hypothetical protein
MAELFNANNLKEIGFGYWFRFTLIGPKNLIYLTNGQEFDLGAVYF